MQKKLGNLGMFDIPEAEENQPLYSIKCKESQ